MFSILKPLVGMVSVLLDCASYGKLIRYSMYINAQKNTIAVFKNTVVQLAFLIYTMHRVDNIGVHVCVCACSSGDRATAS